MDKKAVDKIQIKFKPTDCVEFKWEDKYLIEVKPYISLENKMMLFTNYVDSYFSTDDFVNNYINAIYGLMLGTVELCTNISLKDLDMNALISSGLWMEIKARIKNYNEVASDLYNIIKLFSDQKLAEQSIGTSFDRLSKDLMSFIKGIDLSSEGVEKIVEQLQDASKEFNEKYKVL